MACKHTLPEADAASLLESLRQPKGLAGEVKRYRCTLVTPLYGGGVQAGEVDREQPVRATAIRGQLRYWWRIANRHRFRKEDNSLDSRAMFSAERELWGGLGDEETLTKSKVVVRVSDARSFDRFQSGKKVASDQGLSYILFPAFTRQLAMPGGNVTFRLEISLSGYALREEDPARRRQWLDEAEEAVRWWAHFGGIGARTRRGLGAIHAVNPETGMPLPMPAGEELERAGVRLVTGASHTDPVKALRGVIETYQNLRQGPGLGRNPGQKNRPGRSRWPEPDAIRRLTSEHASIHQSEHPAGQWFPRALFGLPIGFHFKDRKDPGDVVLEPQRQNTQRMASPVILRPVSADGACWYEGCLIVEPDILSQMPELRLGRHKGLHAWPAQRDAQQALAQKIPPLKALDAISPLQALEVCVRRRASKVSLSQKEDLQAVAKAAAEASKPREVLARIQYNRRNGSLLFEPADKKETWKADPVLGEEARALIESLSDAKAQQKLMSGNKHAAKWLITLLGKKVTAIREADK